MPPHNDKWRVAHAYASWRGRKTCRGCGTVARNCLRTCSGISDKSDPVECFRQSWTRRSRICRKQELVRWSLQRLGQSSQVGSRERSMSGACACFPASASVWMIEWRLCPYPWSHCGQINYSMFGSDVGLGPISYLHGWVQGKPRASSCQTLRRRYLSGQSADSMGCQTTDVVRLFGSMVPYCYRYFVNLIMGQSIWYN